MGWPGICTLCSRAEEGICHIFLEYESTKEVWKLNREIGGLATPNSIYDIWKYCKRNNPKNINKSIHDGSLLGATIWKIWLERNNRIFNNNFASPSSLSYSTKYMTSL